MSRISSDVKVCSASLTIELKEHRLSKKLIYSIYVNIFIGEAFLRGFLFGEHEPMFLVDGCF